MHMHHMPPPPPQKKEPACTRIHASDGTLRTTAFLTVYEIEQAARAVRCLRGVVIRDDGKEAGIIVSIDQRLRGQGRFVGSESSTHVQSWACLRKLCSSIMLVIQHT